MNKQIPWLRVAVQGVVIVGSILAAFGVEAGWDARGERLRRAALLEDLQTEISLNVVGLEAALQRQRTRVERVDLLLRELTPQSTGLPDDSVRALQASVLVHPTYDPTFGILNLLIQSGDLTLFEDRVLRARLAGLPSFWKDYLGNQGLLLEVGTRPEVLYGTGSMLFDYAATIPGDELITTGSEGSRVVAAKYLTFVRFLTDDLMIGQGEALLAELASILELLRMP